ncbi:hypothetical protein SBA3_1490008 [Candidatus Sulfopaludibacter sp. SbA3]|nr:hypothetical protein SBA3_1490008 [Candidatus Sulfopaludibacter sp. SbA3]
MIMSPAAEQRGRCLMPNNRGVISIGRDPVISDVDREIADFAYMLWVSTAFRGGSPEQALLTATQMLRVQKPMGPFLVSRRP